MTYFIPVRKLASLFPGSELVSIAVKEQNGKLHLSLGYIPWVDVPEGLGETTEEAFSDLFAKLEAA